MCGITGKLVFDHRQTVSEHEIQNMHQAISHRGPDDFGIYINPGKTVGLANRRLAIIDLSEAGHQPMCNEDGTVWIAFNGEIYNFQDLREDLEKKGHRFRSHTDTETIVHLWEEYGVNCVQFLRGMFAFAIWDENKKQLFLARDRLGKKPLKYFMDEKMIVFGSELKSFINAPGVPKAVDLEALHYYLTLQYVPHPLTGFKGIKKLPQGHTLLIDVSKGKPHTELKRYWKLHYNINTQLTEPEWEERILSKLDEAVRIRMISDVPLGVFLSGGVDSSAVVAFMAKHSTQPVKTFSIGFKEDRFNELPYARRIAEQYGTDHREFIVEPNCIEVLPHMVYHYEEPYADSSGLPSTYLAQMTRQHVTVALNGDGGDENFAGYPWYAVMKMDALYRKFPHWFKRLNRSIIATLYKHFPLKVLRYGTIFTEGALRPQSEVHAELLSYFSSREKAALYTPSFHEISKAWSPGAQFESYYKDFSGEDVLHRTLFTDINTYLVDDLIVKIDIATMAHSLEARSPFLDHEFMELAASIPSHLKYKRGCPKILLKKALRSMLPYDLMTRKKQGFCVPIDHWFNTSLKTYAHDHLLSENAFPSGLFKKTALEHLLKSHSEHGYEGRKIWLLLTLSLWYERFFRSIKSS